MPITRYSLLLTPVLLLEKYETMILHLGRRNTVTSLHSFYVFYKIYTNTIHSVIQQCPLLVTHYSLLVTRYSLLIQSIKPSSLARTSVWIRIFLPLSLQSSGYIPKTS